MKSDGQPSFHHPRRFVMGAAISDVFHAVDVVVQRISFDMIAMVIMVLSLLAMLLAVTLCDGAGADVHAKAA